MCYSLRYRARLAFCHQRSTSVYFSDALQRYYSWHWLMVLKDGDSVSRKYVIQCGWITNISLILVFLGRARALESFLFFSTFFVCVMDIYWSVLCCVDRCCQGCMNREYQRRIKKGTNSSSQYYNTCGVLDGKTTLRPVWLMAVFSLSSSRHDDIYVCRTIRSNLNFTVKGDHAGLPLVLLSSLNIYLYRNLGFVLAVRFHGWRRAVITLFLAIPVGWLVWKDCFDMVLLSAPFTVCFWQSRRLRILVL